jgi:hypothetical protein
MFNARKRRLRAEIEAYSKKLASSDTVTIEETISCQTAMLWLTNELEPRVRAIQTLGLLGAPFVIAPTIRELSFLSKQWPQQQVDGWLGILLDVLREYQLE